MRLSRLLPCLVLTSSVSGCTRLGIDDVVWSCIANTQCGADHECVGGLCRRTRDLEVVDPDTSPDTTSAPDSHLDTTVPAAPPALHDQTLEVQGKSLSDWGATFFQWFWGTPFSVHPLLRQTPYTCLSGQDHGAFMLYPDRGQVRCSVPTDTPILVPLIALSNDACAVQNGPPPGQLQSYVNHILDNTIDLTLEVDGHLLLSGDFASDLGEHLVEATPFAYVEAPAPDNIHTQFYGIATAVDCRDAWHGGVYALIQPLSPGLHTVDVDAYIPIDDPPTLIDMTFTLVVGPPPTLMDPTQPRLGRAGPEWLEDWVQWVMRQPATNHPLVDQTGKDCLAEQPSDVVFLGGALDHTSTTRLCSIPAGRPLALPVVFALEDNAGLPEAEHRSAETLAQLARDALTADATLSLDGRVLDLTELAAHRVEPFAMDYDLPTSDSVREVFFGRAPVVGPVTSAYAAAVFVVLEPLHPGDHVLILERTDGDRKTTVRYHLAVDASE